MSKSIGMELHLPGDGGIVFIPPEQNPKGSVSPRMKKLRAQVALAKFVADDRLVHFAQAQGVRVVAA